MAVVALFQAGSKPFKHAQLFELSNGPELAGQSTHLTSLDGVTPKALFPAGHSHFPADLLTPVANNISPLGSALHNSSHFDLSSLNIWAVLVHLTVAEPSHVASVGHALHVLASIYFAASQAVHSVSP